MSKVLDDFIKYLNTVDAHRLEKDLIESGIEQLEEKEIISGKYDPTEEIEVQIRVNNTGSTIEVTNAYIFGEAA